MSFALLAVAALMPWPLLLGPDNWWAFILASAAILGVLRLIFRADWKRRSGIDVPPAQILLVAAAFVLVAAGSKLLLPIIYKSAGLTAVAPSVEGQAGFLFQAFNEEILSRALLIGLILLYVDSAPLVSVVTAFLFSAAHFLMYRFTNPMHFALSVAALATLFFGFVAMNNLYLAFRHIGFSWALHAGWNVMWLPAAIHDAATRQLLYEPQVFDRVLGSPIMVTVACVTAALTFVFLARRPLGNQGAVA